MSAPPSPCPRAAAVSAWVGLALAFPGCSDDRAAAPEAAVPETAAPETIAVEVPPGTVLLVAGLPLAAEEVSMLAADILELYPEYSTLHARRLALTNEHLPRLATRAQDPEGWSRARETCARAEGLDALAHAVEGGFHALGVGLWSLARHLPEGAWSEPLELTGRWLRLRLDGKTPHVDPRQEALRLSLVEFPFVPPEQASARIEAALDGSVLTLLDPAFAEAVPETWKHRMHATTP